VPTIGLPPHREIIPSGVRCLLLSNLKVALAPQRHKVPYRHTTLVCVVKPHFRHHPMQHQVCHHFLADLSLRQQPRIDHHGQKFALCFLLQITQKPTECKISNSKPCILQVEKTAPVALAAACLSKLTNTLLSMPCHISQPNAPAAVAIHADAIAGATVFCWLDSSLDVYFEANASKQGMHSTATIAPSTAPPLDLPWQRDQGRNHHAQLSVK
jgi:hypothetical protein